MEIKNFKFNDKELRKAVKRKGVALLTGLAIATSSVPALLQPLKVEAASNTYYSNYENNVMNYFMNTLNDNTTNYYPNNNTVYPTAPAPVQQATNANGESINNTVGKDWHASYSDPSLNTSRGESDYVPEYIDENGNLIRYTQEYNEETYAQDEYVEDYAPEYIYTR